MITTKQTITRRMALGSVMGALAPLLISNATADDETPLRGP